MFAGYQLAWYGWVTLKQPVTGGCIGFVDLMLPSHAKSVDACLSNNYQQKTGAQTAGDTWGQGSAATAKAGK